jgi:outer membrane protein assembly factor BamB
VYEPPGLYLAPVPGGRPVVVSARADGSLTALDGGTGAVLWHRQFSDRLHCRSTFTAPRTVVVINRCPVPSTVEFYAASTGKPVAARPPGLDGRPLWPVGCTVGRSGCTGLAGLGAGWLIGPDGGFTAAAGLTNTDGWLVGRLVVHLSGGRVVAHDAVTGAAAWAWPAASAAPTGARIVAVEPDLVHVVTPDGDLFNLDAATGLERSGYPAHLLGVDKAWAPGHVYASHGYVAIERLLPGGRPEGKDSQYYYPFPTVLLTGS